MLIRRRHGFGDGLAFGFARNPVTDIEEGIFASATAIGRCAMAKWIDQLPGRAPWRCLLKGIHGVAGARFTRIDLVVVEVLAIQEPGLVPGQTVFGDRLGIEFDLYPDVLRYGKER